MDNVLMIAVTETKRAASKETILEGRLTAAMNATKDHWMVTDEDARFRAAVGGVLLLSEGEDKERIESEIKQLKILAAMLSGIPIINPEPLLNPIGLMKMWKKIKGQ